MSQRTSGFVRVPADLYQSPPWLVDALAEHINLTGLSVWEPACGEGQMVRAMEAAGAHVTGTDLNEYPTESQASVFDFADPDFPEQKPLFHFDAIITNPPYGPRCTLAEKFVERGLERIPAGGLLALLLPVDFDSAKGRARFFADCPHFAAKIVLRRRILWFSPEPGTKASSPSANHAWFIWLRSHMRSPWCPVTLYAPSQPVEKINPEMEAA